MPRNDNGEDKMISEQDMKDIEKFIDNAYSFAIDIPRAIDKRMYASATERAIKIRDEAHAIKAKLKIGFGYNNENPDASDFI
tara:strand:- start:212 stop:457 length:246 start_codon:yes stop_codon:yes gene_type:complete